MVVINVTNFIDMPWFIIQDYNLYQMKVNILNQLRHWDMYTYKILENWCTWFLTLKHLYLSFAGTSQFGIWDHVWDRGGWDVMGWYGKRGLFLQAINSNWIKTFGFNDTCVTLSF